MSPERPCHVCGELLVQPDTATCYQCDREFHAAMTITSLQRDCGTIFIHTTSLGLMFICRDCRPLGSEWEPVAG